MHGVRGPTGPVSWYSVLLLFMCVTSTQLHICVAVSIPIVDINLNGDTLGNRGPARPPKYDDGGKALAKVVENARIEQEIRTEVDTLRARARVLQQRCDELRNRANKEEAHAAEQNSLADNAQREGDRYHTNALTDQERARQNGEIPRYEATHKAHDLYEKARDDERKAGRKGTEQRAAHEAAHRAQQDKDVSSDKLNRDERQLTDTALKANEAAVKADNALGDVQREKALVGNHEADARIYDKEKDASIAEGLEKENEEQVAKATAQGLEPEIEDAKHEARFEDLAATKAGAEANAAKLKEDAAKDELFKDESDLHRDQQQEETAAAKADEDASQHRAAETSAEEDKEPLAEAKSQAEAARLREKDADRQLKLAETAKHKDDIQAQDADARYNKDKAKAVDERQDAGIARREAEHADTNAQQAEMVVAQDKSMEKRAHEGEEKAAKDEQRAEQKMESAISENTLEKHKSKLAEENFKKATAALEAATKKLQAENKKITDSRAKTSLGEGSAKLKGVTEEQEMEMTRDDDQDKLGAAMRAKQAAELAYNKAAKEAGDAQSDVGIEKNREAQAQREEEAAAEREAQAKVSVERARAAALKAKGVAREDDGIAREKTNTFDQLEDTAKEEKEKRDDAQNKKLAADRRVQAADDAKARARTDLSRAEDTVRHLEKEIQSDEQTANNEREQETRAKEVENESKAKVDEDQLRVTKDQAAVDRADDEYKADVAKQKNAMSKKLIAEREELRDAMEKEDAARKAQAADVDANKAHDAAVDFGAKAHRSEIKKQGEQRDANALDRQARKDKETAVAAQSNENQASAHVLDDKERVSHDTGRDNEQSTLENIAGTQANQFEDAAATDKHDADNQVAIASEMGQRQGDLESRAQVEQKAGDKSIADAEQDRANADDSARRSDADETEAMSFCRQAAQLEQQAAALEAQLPGKDESPEIPPGYAAPGDPNAMPPPSPDQGGGGASGGGGGGGGGGPQGQGAGPEGAGQGQAQGAEQQPPGSTGSAEGSTGSGVEADRLNLAKQKEIEKKLFEKWVKSKHNTPEGEQARVDYMQAKYKREAMEAEIEMRANPPGSPKHETAKERLEAAINNMKTTTVQDVQRIPDGVINNVASGMNEGEEILSGSWNRLKANKVGQAVKPVIRDAKNLASTAYNGIGDIKDATVDVVKQGYEDTKDVVKDAATGTANVVGEVVDQGYNVAKEGVSSAVDHAGALKDKAGARLNGAVNVLKAAVGSGTVADAMAQNKQNYAAVDAQADAKAAAADNKLKDAVKTGVSGVAGTAEQGISKVGSAVDQLKGNLAEGKKEIGDAVSDAKKDVAVAAGKLGLSLASAMVKLRSCLASKGKSSGGGNTCNNYCVGGNSKAKSSPNGCGPEGGCFPVPDVDVGPCCSAHDMCYTNCKVGKAKCELDFALCIASRCDQRDHKVCLQLGFVLATWRLGCDAWISARNKYCTCP